MNGQWQYIVGWYMFLVSSVFFLVESAIDADWIGFGASFFFMGGCLVYLWPFPGRKNKSKTEHGQ